MMLGLGLGVLIQVGADGRLYSPRPTTDRFTSGQAVRSERTLGPFKIGKRTFTIILRLQRIKGAPDGFEETVEFFSIMDEGGAEHFRRSFEIEAEEGRFSETVGLSAFALESPGRKIFRTGPGGPGEEILGQGETVGLLIYYGCVPSAPSAGLSCQVFSLVADHLTPTSPPLTVYGKIRDLQPGIRPDSKRLGPGETMEFGVWTGWFEVVVPVRVLEELRVVPLHRHLTFGLDAFPVAVDRVAQERETFVRLFRSPDDPTPAHVIVRKTSEVEFISVYAAASFDKGAEEVVISVGSLPWLKLRIDGQEGFVKDEEDLMALGLRPAG